jgi:hypothetical protein
MRYILKSNFSGENFLECDECSKKKGRRKKEFKNVQALNGKTKNFNAVKNAVRIYRKIS